jgi:hypothetical protein
MNWSEGSASGEVWHSDFLRRKTNLEKQLYSPNNNASEEQRKAYELLFGRNGFKPQNLCLVGVGGAGKTWIAKKLSNLLQCVFFCPGEVIRCAPLGRQACGFHPDARTIHSIIRLRPNSKHQYPESLFQIQEHLKHSTDLEDNFSAVKVFIVSEAFMCNSPHLEAILMHVKSLSPDCKFLFDGDCMQLLMKPTRDYPGIPFLTRDRFQEVCPNTQIIVFEKCMTYRIQNAVKLAHMGKMRLGIAEQDTIDYLKNAKIPKEQHPVLRVFANARPAAEFNEQKLNLALKTSKSKSFTVLQAKDFWTDSKVATTMSANEDQSLSVEANIKVVQGAPILIVQNHLAEKSFGQQQGQKLHVGNGTTGIFREYELATDSIIVDVQLSDRREYVRIKRWNFFTEMKTRSQFPIMLAWAATIQKIQGMEFKFLEADFCLNYYATPSSGRSDFFQGCAYMVFTRAEIVAVIGDITLHLLNNVNSWCLQWWKSQVSLWNNFRKTQGLERTPVFRNAIHQHNWHAAQLQQIANNRISAKETQINLKRKRVHNCDNELVSNRLKPASIPAHLCSDGSVFVPEAETNVEVAAKASANAENDAKAKAETEAKSHAAAIHSATPAVRPAAAQALVPVPAPVSGPALAPDSNSAPAPALAPAVSATAAKRRAGESVSATADNLPAHAPGPAPASALVTTNTVLLPSKEKVVHAHRLLSAHAAKQPADNQLESASGSAKRTPAPASASAVKYKGQAHDGGPSVSASAFDVASALSKAKQILPTKFTSLFIAQAQAQAQAQALPVTGLKRQTSLPGQSCHSSVFPATKTFASTKKLKLFPTIEKIGGLIEV